MKRPALVGAAALLLSTAVTASAADLSQSSSHAAASPSSHAASSTMAQPASDTLSLTGTQRKTAWRDLRSEAAKQSQPAGFSASVGQAVPTTFKIEPVPTKVGNSIPVLRPYDFAMMKGKLLIVNPSDKKIVEVITG